MKLYRPWREGEDWFQRLKRLLWLRIDACCNWLLSPGLGSDGWPFTLDSSMRAVIAARSVLFACCCVSKITFQSMHSAAGQLTFYLLAFASVTSTPGLFMSLSPGTVNLFMALFLEKCDDLGRLLWCCDRAGRRGGRERRRDEDGVERGALLQVRNLSAAGAGGW